MALIARQVNVSNGLTKLPGGIKGDLAVNLIRTFLARAVAALGSLVLLVVVGRYYGPAAVGVLAIAQSALVGAGMLAKGGMDNALMRYVGQSPDSKYVFTYLAWAIKPALLLSVFISVVLFYSRFWVSEQFGASGLAEVLSGIAFAVPAFVLAYIFSGFFKGIRMPATACLMENGIISLVAGVVVWLFLNLQFLREDLTILGIAYFLAAIVVLFQGVIQFAIWKKRWVQKSISKELADCVTKESFNSTSRAFFASSMANFMQSVVAILIAGWMLDNSDLGLFKTAQQLGMLIAFILLVINAIFPPRFAGLFKNGDIAGLTRLAKMGALVGIVFVSPLVIICIVFPEWVLNWFGPEFSQAAWLLRIIVIGQLVNVATGSVGFLLSMTGHEKLMRDISLVCNALGLFVFFVFIKWFGVLGAALALALVLVVQNLSFLYFVWIKLGIWTLPTPNLLALFRVQTQAKLSG